jgi:dethiobiotin synthetase
MTGRGFFVTGTDTDVGKTWIAAGLIRSLQRAGLRTVGMKPVSCGCVETASGPRNEDALILIRHSSEPPPPYERVNRYAFVPPMAPHLAAAAAGVTIELAPIRRDFEDLASGADAVVVEGAGGWYVPLNERETVADLARALALPIVLVVGIRLGCLNHALLSAAAIRSSGLVLAGWMANLIDPHALLIEQNIESLRMRLPAPLLGTVPHMAALDAERIADGVTRTGSDPLTF